MGMSFLDKAKEKASQLTQAAKEKVDDIKDDRKADELLDDIGRIVYRQRTEASLPSDDADINALVAQLKELDAKGANILDKPAAADTTATLPPPPPPAAAPPPPPPPPG